MEYAVNTTLLTKKFGQHTAVNQVNLHVKRGEIYGFIGRNGAGKTTCMKMLCGLATPTSGEISLFGKQGTQAREMYERIGNLIETPGLYPMLDFHIPISDINLNIVENICNLLELKSGYILNSGESYHFISSTIVTWEDLYLTLSKALRFCPILDRTWISHQLEEKSCSLRVDRKNGVEPMMVRLVR